mmetsp:Transcript_33025/g.104426  ORF Transcript_33025/g.104426 Transcript_33025/m.104426 type:complete len:309 (-) Transcript_33025:484-1410(-)
MFSSPRHASTGQTRVRACLTCLSLACSSRRPRQRPSSQHVHVQVKNFLAGPSPVVDHQPVVAQSLLRRHLGDDREHVAEDAFVLGCGEPELGERLPPLGNHEEMGGSLRVDIFEDQHFVIFKHNLRRNALSYNLVKDRLFSFVTFSGVQDSSPSIVLVPLRQSIADLLLHFGEGWLAQHPLVPADELRTRQFVKLFCRQLGFSWRELGHHVHHEHHGGKHGRVCKRDLLSGNVGALVVHVAVDGLKLPCELLQRVSPAAKLAKRRSRAVHGALNGGDVHVVKATDKIALHTCGRSRRDEGWLLRRELV